MGLNQAWPASMEVQFLAVGTTAGRQTGNVCTPGTNLEMKGKLLTDHIIDSTSKLFPVDEWVQVEVEVHGNDEVIHRINGVEVLRYQHPQLDPKEESAQALLAAGAPLQLSFGHIALQAEIAAGLVPQHPDSPARLNDAHLCLATRTVARHHRSRRTAGRARAGSGPRCAGARGVATSSRCASRAVTSRACAAATSNDPLLRQVLPLAD